jgi:hypothetical protein
VVLIKSVPKEYLKKVVWEKSMKIDVIYWY